MTFVYDAFRWSEAGLFLAAAILKIHSPEEFWYALGRVSWLTGGWAPFAGAALISLELLAAILLGVRSTARLGAWLASGLFAIFFSYAFWMQLRGMEGGCGCFPGARGPLSSADLMLLDLVGLAVSILLIRSRATVRGTTIAPHPIPGR